MMMQLEKLKIVRAGVDDLSRLHEIALAMKAAKDIGYFERAMEHQEAGERLVFLAEYDGAAAGYCMLAWSPKYAFYRAMGYPEIQDLNVLPDFRQCGIASAMIGHCEELARQKGVECMGISVGLTASYGPAQKLYIKLGYIPDGHGVTCDRQPVALGEFRPVDNDLCLMLVKDLQS
ncbi:MAG: GNAT family N-acetyltransferase [Rhodospirillales bacterium]|nr:GNAT family N-acetyltransferase [Rhodospirillales bacterium]